MGMYGLIDWGILMVLEKCVVNQLNNLNVDKAFNAYLGFDLCLIQ